MSVTSKSRSVGSAEEGGEEEASRNASGATSETFSTDGSVKLVVDGFGSYTDLVTRETEIVRRFTWTNAADKVLVQVMSYGATITKLCLPDRHGAVEDIVLGYDTLGEYFHKQNPYFGATVGRVCNRIAHGEFTIDGQEFQVSRNWNNRHTLHGGFHAFDKKNWVSHVDGTRVIMSLVSKAGSEGFPGTVMAQATFDLLPNSKFKVIYTATTSNPTPINLTNHSYFNLAGHGAAYPETYKHIVTINADQITETDADSIPTGRLLNVGGTLFDFRIPKVLGTVMTRVKGRGYDDNFCVIQGTEQGLTFVARVLHPDTGRTMEVYSDQPGVQFYTANFMPDPLDIITPENVNTKYFYQNEEAGSEGSSIHTVRTMDEAQTEDGLNEEGVNEEEGDDDARDPPINGKHGAKYYKHGAFCFETQKYPDAVHHSNFKSSILYPGQTYRHEMILKFGIYTEDGSGDCVPTVVC